MIKYKNKKVISDRDFDDLVTTTYGRPYTFQQQDGCKNRGTWDFTVPSEEFWDYENDTIPEIVNGPERGVSFKSWLARDPAAPLVDQNRSDLGGIRLWWARNFYPEFGMVVNDLHAKGLIEAGEYTLDVNW